MLSGVELAPGAGSVAVGKAVGTEVPVASGSWDGVGLGEAAGEGDVALGSGGAVVVEGTRDGAPVSGRGYLEMTGYSGQAMGRLLE